MRFIRFAAIAAVSLSATVAPVLADEAWDTAYGRVVWDADLGDMAILQLNDVTNDTTVRMYVPGLAADVMGGRGAYQGFWIASGGDPADACLAQMAGPDGVKSNHWGQFTITFVNEAFPSDWAGVFGACFETQTAPMSGVVPEY